MVTSIVLLGEYSIGLDKNDKFEVDQKKISVKEVPFVRYRLQEYTEDTVNYIKKMKEQFRYSAHMAEITVKPGVRQVLDFLTESVENLIQFMYIPVTDKEVQEGLGQEMIELLKECNGAAVDRVMIKDNSTSLYLVSANNIKKQIASVLGINPMEIGICSSPLSFNGEACLTAVMARQLSAMYSENDEAALPSANHECMQTCGCIRYVEIANHILSTIIKDKPSNKEDTKKSTSKTKVSGKVLPRLFA